MKKYKGFTLIELLITITIMVILAALAFTSYSSAQKSARDARRRSDLGQYRNALQAYAANNEGKFPITNGYSTSGGSGLFASGGPLIPLYLPSLIPDPLNNCTGGTWAYCYAYAGSSPDGSQWVLGVALETEGGTKHWEICSNGKAGKAVASGGYVCDIP